MYPVAYTFINCMQSVLIFYSLTTKVTFVGTLLSISMGVSVVSMKWDVTPYIIVLLLATVIYQIII